MAITTTIQGDEAFIQGQYLSIGINRSGSLGTRQAAPDGYYSDEPAGFLRTGLFADMDGFGRGAANRLSDAILPGRAIEGFNIGYKIDGETIVQSNQSLTGYNEVDGSNSKTGTAGQIAWRGTTDEDLAVSQRITLQDNAKYIRIDVTLTNNSSETMSDVRYMRTADPDQAEAFATTNRIVRQGDDDGALVSSAFGGKGASFFLFSEDDRAVVSTFGFVNTDPYTAAAYSSPQREGFSETADKTVNITFGLGTLDPGESTTVTLFMGVTDDLEDTIERIEDDDSGGEEPPPPVDLAPVAADDVLTLDENGVGRGNVLTNDRDPEGEDLTASLRSGPSNGKVTLSSDGSYIYTPDKGFSGTDSFTYAASDGNKSDTATVRLTVRAEPDPVDLPPVANDDALTLDENGVGRGNVLSNDRDPEGEDLTASLRSGPSNGKVTLSSDGSYTYAPNKGFSGTDSFTYAASDGNKSDTATVRLTIRPEPDPEPEPLPDTPLLDRAGTRDGSARTSDTLTGAAYYNSFFFSVDAVTGDDRITNFGKNDILVLDELLGGGDDDEDDDADGGLIDLDDGLLSLGGGDSVTLSGVSDLRYLGRDTSGVHVYADADVRPDDAIEGGLGDDRLAGDRGNDRQDVFFYDTALDIDLGDDRIDNFGDNDLLITTSVLYDSNGDQRINFGLGHLRLYGVSGAPGDEASLGETGTVRLFDTDGDAIRSLEFDRIIERDGVTYYVYSRVEPGTGVSSSLTEMSDF